MLCSLFAADERTKNRDIQIRCRGGFFLVCFVLFLTFPLSRILCVSHSAAGSCQPGIIAWSDDKLAPKSRDSPGISFYYLKGFSYSRLDLSQNDILHDLKIII